jgi:hypothetical protein
MQDYGTLQLIFGYPEVIEYKSDHSQSQENEIDADPHLKNAVLVKENVQ